MTDFAFPASRPFTAPAVWSGRILSGAIGSFLALEGLARLLTGRGLVEPSATAAAIDPALQSGLGAVLVLGAGLLALRRTRLVGAAVLAVGVGGPLAAELRAATPSSSHILFWAYVGVLVIGGLALRRLSPSR